MPKDMFFNISEEKRNMFLSVALKEFTTKSFEDVSVNSIIKKAGISRGSFYTYFENLESLFNYLLKRVKDKRFKQLQIVLKETQGDFFEAFRKLFVYDFDAYNRDETYSLFKNYIHFVQVNKKGNLEDTLIRDMVERLDSPGTVISKANVINKLGLTEEEFMDLLEISLLLMINTFTKSENNGLSKEDTIALFNRRMNQLEFGTRFAKNTDL